MAGYSQQGSSCSYPFRKNKGKNKGKSKQRMIKKPDRRVPGTGLAFDDDVMRQMSGNYHKASVRKDETVSPMRLMTAALG